MWKRDQCQTPKQTNKNHPAPSSKGLDICSDDQARCSLRGSRETGNLRCRRHRVQAGRPPSFAFLSAPGRPCRRGRGTITPRPSVYDLHRHPPSTLYPRRLRILSSVSSCSCGGISPESGTEARCDAVSQGGPTHPILAQASSKHRDEIVHEKNFPMENDLSGVHWPSRKRLTAHRPGIASVQDEGTQRVAVTAGEMRRPSDS